MIEIRCDNDFRELVNKTRIKNILNTFLNRLFEGHQEVSLYITNDAEIQKLNKQFRNKNLPTDILSWAYHSAEGESDEEEMNDRQQISLSGELVVSAERVRIQAAENGWDFETELIRLLAHGCAHLAGWDHEESEEEERKMLELEIQLLQDVGLDNIY